MALSRTGKSWHMRPLPDNISMADCQQLAAQVQLPLPVVRLLAKRGLTDAQTIHTFLNPSLQNLPSPFIMKGMKRAVGIFADAIKEQRPIIVYGDYDADGITATALLTLILQECGGRVSHYVPDRFEEGYGLNSRAVQTICTQDNGATEEKLLITVDCGISDAVEVREARQLGCSVIITDHHTPPMKLPEADAVLNPLQPGCMFPFKHLAGVGVAFFLVMGLRKALFDKGWWQTDAVPNLKTYLDLVALGSIADLVPLQDINRILVSAGLEVMNSRMRLGLAKLYAIATRYGNNLQITAEDVAFKLAPRINAVGRMKSADKAVMLLTTDNAAQAAQIAEELEEANEQRKEFQQQLFSNAHRQAENLIKKKKSALVLCGKDWHVGVLGIVASQICESFHRPTIVLSIEANRIKGSGRSVKGMNLYKALSLCTDYIEQFGGHKRAAGLTINPDNLEKFREKFEQVTTAMLNEDDLVARLEYDDHIEQQFLFSKTFLQHYVRLAPFGKGNPEPLFVCDRLKFSSARIVGANHLKFTILDNETSRNGIGFNLGFVLPGINDTTNMGAFHLRYNHFQGKGNWEMNLVDLKTAPTTVIVDNK
jgi:single-stranded-DNA-specific exonuclease